ncbi:MAG: DNA polymerase III subunit alpha [Acidimicrobiales bacterium]
MTRARRDGFAHLHTHTEFSMLDGASRIGDLVAAAASDGQPGMAITDHGNMYGVLDFYKACRSAGLNPVIGTEAYMAATSRYERPVRRGKVDDTGGEAGEGSKLYYHLVLLAETTAGYKNLIKLSSAAYLEGYYYKPRVDWELLESFHEGLIATTGCLGGVVNQALLAGDDAKALQAASRLQDIFGKDNLFIELQDHGIEDQRATNPKLVEISRKIGAPLLATNDSHYTHRSDAVAHDALLCVQTGATIAETSRFRFDGEEHYLKSSSEMRNLFSGLEEACDNTLDIVERADVRIEFGQVDLPRFPVPEEFKRLSAEQEAREYLGHLTSAGARERYGERVPGEVTERIDYELSVISDMGFSAYFLVVWDLIRHARASGIRVGPGRGSAAGCCVAYCLGIVELDPIRHDLLFERFLNPGRRQMPDIDMDFDERFRSEMIAYAADRYGSDHVAQVVTFSTIKARAAVRDAARVLGYPYSVGDRAAKAMPPLVMGRDTPLWACLEEDPGHRDGYKAAAGLREMYETDPDTKKVIDVARGLEGLRRQDGIHAAAVVITAEPLTEYLPLQRKPGPGGDISQAPLVTQYEMHGVEELGLLKMDFLGLRNLSVIERALDLIEATAGRRPDIDSVPLDDPETLAMLRRGDSIGVFQLEGGPMRTLMRSLAPTNFGDVAALVALYRPGPMAANMHNDYADRKNGRKPVSYPHPDLEEVLVDTYGLMIYQESVMRVAQRVAGYTLSEADNLRKACGKKIRSMIAAEREKFVAGCETTGYGAELGQRLFDIIEPFADYAFNKSHAYGYGYVAYQTAWLKAHYPVEYLAALLTSVKDDKDKTAIYLAECRSIGIEVTVPDVNVSSADFTVGLPPAGQPVAPASPGGGTTGRVTFGLAAVRNVGEGLVEAIVRERDANGAFTDFVDFCRRVDPMVLNRRAMESLIKAGAFDSLGHPRKGLVDSFPAIVERVLAERREREHGVMSLFGPSFPAQGGPAQGGPAQGGPAQGGRAQGGPVGPGGATGARGNGPLAQELAIASTEASKQELLAWEKEMLGLYVSDHPLSGLQGALRRQADVTIAELKDPQSRREGEQLSVAGVVTNLVRRYTKRGEPMATFILEDLESSLQAFVFPKAMAATGEVLTEDAVVVARGRLDWREDEAKLVVSELRRVVAATGAEPVTVKVPPHVLSGDLVGELKRLFMEHRGGHPIVLEIGERAFRLPVDMAVEPRSGLVAELKSMLGPQAVMLGAAEPVVA